MKSGADDHERLLGKANTGAQARLANAHLQPMIAELEGRVLQKLKNDFRSGKFDPVAVQCEVAKLVAYDDLSSKLKGEIVIGESATKKIQGEGDNS